MESCYPKLEFFYSFVLKKLLIIGNVELNPGPKKGPMNNLANLEETENILQSPAKDLPKTMSSLVKEKNRLKSKVQENENKIDILKCELNLERSKKQAKVAKPILEEETIKPLLETAVKDIPQVLKKLSEEVDGLLKMEQLQSEEINNLLLELDQLKEEDKIELQVSSVPKIPGLRSVVLKACRTGQWHLCKRVLEEQLDKSSILYKQVCDIREYSRLPWEIAGKGHVELLTILLENGLPLNLAKPTGYSETMLHISARSNQISVVKFLIAMGADVNVKDNAGDSPLHDAARNGYIDIAKLLLENKALINATNKNKETPLHHAIKYLHVSVVEYLVNLGCNKGAIDRNKKTALDIAKSVFLGNDCGTLSKFHQIKEILSSH